MFGLGVPELILILVVVLLFFGPKKLPELGSFLGSSLRDFRNALDQRDQEPDDTGNESSAAAPRVTEAEPVVMEESGEAGATTGDRVSSRPAGEAKREPGS